MKPPKRPEALQMAVGRLRELLASPDAPPSVGEPPTGAPLPEGVDEAVAIGDWTFALAWTHSGATAPVAGAAQALLRALAGVNTLLGHTAPPVPVVVAPYMGDAGASVCRSMGAQWMDLSGNACLRAPGLVVHIQGHDNQYKAPGRPQSLFAPKSQRVARFVLMHPEEAFTQREIARATELGEGFVSRIVRALADGGLLENIPQGEGRAWRAVSPQLLWQALCEDYDFGAHEVLRGHFPAVSADAALTRLSGLLRQAGIAHAATAASAASLLTAFGAHRQVTVFVEHLPDATWRRTAGFLAQEEGANCWLVVPEDPGVLHGVTDVRGVPCVHPVQASLDVSAATAGARAREVIRMLHARWNPPITPASALPALPPGDSTLFGTEWPGEEELPATRQLSLLDGSGHSRVRP